MENEIIEKRQEEIFVNRNGNSTTIQVSDETMEKLYQLGLAATEAAKQMLINAIDRELELQIREMECTVVGQKNALDSHERKQNDLLADYQKKEAAILWQMNNAQNDEVKLGCLRLMETYEKQLTEKYISNNLTLDNSLDKAKQKTRGILNFFSGFFLGKK